MEYYLVIKNEFESMELSWMNLEPVTQSVVKSGKKK